MADEAEIRGIAPDELDAWSDGEWMSWGYRHGEPWRRVLSTCDVRAAVDGGELVAGAAATPFVLTVPGGVLPVAGVASVWVSPTRRGEGFLRRLMDVQLTSFVEEGIAAAVLIASEPGIHRRFGFGVASFAARLRIAPSSRTAMSEVRASDLTLADRDVGVATAAEIYERVRRGSPGMLDRSPAWWGYSYPEPAADDEHPTLFVLHSEDGAAYDGYAAYTVEAGWTEEGRPDNTAVLHELVAETPRGYAGLWSYCLGLSLCGRVEAENRPVDEPLVHMLGAPEILRQSVVDGLQLRIFDVPAALSTRRYSAAGAVVLAVHDDAGGWARGSWLVEGDPEGATCTSTRRSPDLALDAATLGSAYLGGSSFEALHRAGLVEELRAGAIRRADQLFSWSPAPWLPWDY